MKTPWFPRIEAPRPPTKPKPVDLRVRTDRAEVLAGIDEEGRLFQVWDDDFAVGPGNLRYSLQTLLELADEGTVAVHDYTDKAWQFQDLVNHIKKERGEEPSVDDAGTVGNSYPNSMTWSRVK